MSRKWVQQNAQMWMLIYKKEMPRELCTQRDKEREMRVREMRKRDEWDKRPEMKSFRKSVGAQRPWEESNAHNTKTKHARETNVRLQNQTQQRQNATEMQKCKNMTKKNLKWI